MSTLKERMEELAVDQPRGWQADLARHCGIKPPSVNGWLKGTSLTIEGDHLFKAAEFFGVVPAWLSSGALPKFPPEQRGATPGAPVRYAKCDTQGNYLLQRVPAGRWLLVAQVQTRMLQREVQITDGAVHQFDLTEANALR